MFLYILSPFRLDLIFCLPVSRMQAVCCFQRMTHSHQNFNSYDGFENAQVFRFDEGNVSIDFTQHFLGEFHQTSQSQKKITANV